jgi:hypothetical protein
MITLILEKIGIKQPKKHSTHKPSVLWRITHDKAYDLIYGFSHQAITDIIKDLEQYLLCNLNNKHKSTPIGENLAEFIRLIANHECNEVVEVSDLSQEVIDQIIDGIAMICYRCKSIELSYRLSTKE